MLTKNIFVDLVYTRLPWISTNVSELFVLCVKQFVKTRLLD